MPATYDLATDRGKVRLLCNDTKIVTPVFDDTEIDQFLALEASNVKAAAALALETIATSEALTQKSIRVLELQMDGPAVARALLQRAALLRTQANEELPAFDWAETIVDDFSYRERVWKEAQRGSA